MTPAIRWAARLVGAGLLGATAAIHADLYYHQDYHYIPKIGVSFLMLYITAIVIGVAVLAAPKRLLPFAAFLGAGLQISTLGGLLISTHHKLFGFREVTSAPFYYESAIIEIIGALVLGSIVIAWILKRSPDRA